MGVWARVSETFSLLLYWRLFVWLTWIVYVFYLNKYITSHWAFELGGVWGTFCSMYRSYVCTCTCTCTHNTYSTE